MKLATKYPMANKHWFIIGFMLWASTLLSHNGPDLPVQSQKLVYDGAGLLSSYEVNNLENKLRSYNDSTGSQIAIITVSHLHNDIGQSAIELGHKWGVGQAEDDNGIVVLISEDDRELFIATGYGAEIFVTDVYAKRIIDNVMRPNFRAGNFYTGLDQATDIMIDLMAGEYDAPKQVQSEGIPLWVIVLVIVIILILLSNRRKGRRQYEYYRRGRRVYDGSWGRGPGNWPDFDNGGGVFRVPSGGSRGGSRGGRRGGGFGGFGGGGFGGGGAGGGW